MRVLAILSLLLLTTLPALAADDKESAFERVMRTGTIRCGYYVFPPVTYRDPNTGELSGLSVDMMNEIGERAGLEIEWAEEVTFGNWIPALQSKRFDVVCTPMWPEIPMARAAAFSVPMFYAGLSPMVRADDPRYQTDDLSVFNDPDVTFVTQDGNAIDILTRKAFPKAKISPVSAAVEGPVVLQEVVTGKADAILMDRNGEIEYNRHNPVKLRLVAPDRPIKAQSFTLAVGRDEMVLKDFLDNAINELLNDGSVDRMLDRWETEPGLYLRVSKPYEAKH
ncbi:MAG: amino acid ABC transporter substrate-binding protein [Alphaproteobacteria bacterium]|nr:amino acid ABC transporter substrate-binding protein [Alphaproteobacteria bacterium]